LGQHVDGQPLRVKFSDLRKLHDLHDDDFSHGVFPAAIELQYRANPLEGCPHGFYMFGVHVELRKWHGRTHGMFTFPAAYLGWRAALSIPCPLSVLAADLRQLWELDRPSALRPTAR
jgi:hypothetical protein